MAYEDLLTANPVSEIIATSLGVSVATAIAIFLIISIWSLIWKALALWKSARKNQVIWFIALLLINTVGILEILYIFVFSKIGEKKLKLKLKKRKK